MWDVTGRSEARGTEFALATRRHVRNFLDSVKSRQKPNCDMEAGFAASLPCLLAIVAIQQEKTVKWDGKKATGGARASYFAFSFLVAVPDMTYAPPAKSIWALILPSAAGVSETTAGTAFPW